MNDVAFALLNDFQRGFPLTAKPFEAIARRVGMEVEELLQLLQRLRRDGVISRVGAVFRPNRIGVSTLAAMAVPAARLMEVAAAVSARPQVNHNYEREHRFNLWFVATARDAQTLSQTLEDIEQETGLAVMRLPMVRDYHIDLGFDLDATVARAHLARSRPHAGEPVELDPLDYALIGALQDGLPLVPRPYARLAAAIGSSEAEVLRRLARFLEQDIISRLGIVVRHHELGFRANAMVVWDVPDDRVDAVGECIGQSGLVNLCYRRPRRLPEWRYNLFCMIHGRDRAAVLERLELIRQQCGLAGLDYEVLFSRRRFKQTGARYVDVKPQPAEAA